jgi:hypothetical protein
VTSARIDALDRPTESPRRNSTSTGRTPTWIEMRSRRGPEIFERYFSIWSGLHRHWYSLEPR